MKTYILFHKPAGYITARSDQRHKTVMDFFPPDLREELHPVGRLDKDTEGLLLITNDGKWNQYLMSPAHRVMKEYFFIALGTISPRWHKKLEEGVVLPGEESETAPAKLEIMESMTLTQLTQDYCINLAPKVLKNPPESPVTLGKIFITEGKKHQVKRMLKVAGCYVIYLRRDALGNLRLGNELPGTWRNLTEEEIKGITL